MKGGKIVRLFVNMHNIWLYLAHNAAQLRIKVQMKVAVQDHRRHNHRITSRIEPFQYLFTAIITLPVGRCDHGEFDIRALRQFFKFPLRGACHETFGYHQYTHSYFLLLTYASSYAASVSIAALCQLNCAARCSERRRKSSCNERSINTWRMASARAGVSLGSTLKAASPTTSGNEVRFEHTTAAPQLMASSGGRPKPS